jgi:cytochrome P450 family 313
VFEELKTVFGDVGDEIPYIDYEKVNELVYLEMVINETMRLLPVVPMIFRYVSKNIQIGDYEVPEGSNLFLPIMKIHRSKKIWGEDAMEFRPERFEKEEIAKIHPYAYLPFSSELSILNS